MTAKYDTLNETRQKFEEWARTEGILVDPYSTTDLSETSLAIRAWQAGRLQGLEESQLIALDLACKAVAAAIREKIAK